MEFIEGSKPTNKKHINNLLKLADFLESDKIPPPRFDMSEFLVEEREGIVDTWENPKKLQLDPVDAKPKKYATCDTVACAIGHGPMAGIRVHKDDNWFSYSFRVFGVDGLDSDNTHYAYDWLFDPDWFDTDNTPQGAAARIRIYVENGVPVNWPDQRYGDVGLMYSVEPETRDGLAVIEL